MEPVGVLARCRLVLGLIHIMITILGILLVNLSGLINDMGSAFYIFGIMYLVLEIISHALPYLSVSYAAAVDRKLFALSVSKLFYLLLFGILQQAFHSFAGNDGWERLLQACWWVMMLLNCLEFIIDSLMYDDPWRGEAIAVPVGNGNMRVPLGLFGQFGGVLIRCGRVLGGFDGLVAWRLGLGTMGAALLTLVLGGFGSVMTANVLRTCVVLGYLETILVCASRQKMLDVYVRFRYIYVSMVKIVFVLVGYLIQDNYLHSFTESSGCEEGSACYSRLRECFWVMLVFYFLEVFLGVLLLFVHHPRQELQNMANRVTTAWVLTPKVMANFYGGIICMSSTLSTTLVAIVGLLLGGSYGPLMTTKGFWLCGSTLFVEMAALMGITDWVAKVLKSQVDSGMSLSDTRSAFIMVPTLRVFGLSIITILLVGEKFFIADMSNCDETCKARGTDLLAVFSWTIAFQLGHSFCSLALMFFGFFE